MKVVPLHKAIAAGVDYFELAGGRAAVSSAAIVGWRGLGDALEAAFKAVGIKKAADVYTQTTGGGCGCTKRRDKLNELVPFHVERQGLSR